MCIVVGFKDAIYATKKINPPYKVYIDLSDTERTESKKGIQPKKQCSLYIIILIISLEMKNSAW